MVLIILRKYVLKIIFRKQPKLSKLDNMWRNSEVIEIFQIKFTDQTFKNSFKNLSRNENPKSFLFCRPLINVYKGCI